jgi:hypothetical protein
MQLLPKHQPSRQTRSGMATIIVIALLAIILMYVAANARTLGYLKRDLHLVEQKHQRRLALPAASQSDSVPGQTNAPPEK